MSEVLARLNASTIDINHIPGGFGALSSSDIAYCLAGMPDLEKRYAMHSYVHTPESYDLNCTIKADLLMLYNAITRLLQTELSVREAKARKLGVVVICTMRDGSVCVSCKGKKIFTDASGHNHKCFLCNQSGFMTRSDSDLARMADVPRQNWARDFEKDYAETVKIVTGIKQYIYHHVRRRLK